MKAGCKPKKKKKAKFQFGGFNQGANFNMEPTLEIEDKEYIFDEKGIGENDFKMIDSTNKKFISKYGFLANGKKHGKGNEAGIKVNANKGYVASSFLGLDGKKANKNNPSVAETMLKYGGKALAKYSDKNWDKFGINKNNPNALKHHLSLMKTIRDEAEFNKSFLKATESTNKAKHGLDLNLSKEQEMLTKKQKRKLPTPLKQAIMRTYFSGGYMNQGFSPNNMGRGGYNSMPMMNFGGYMPYQRGGYMVPMYGQGGSQAGYNSMAPFFSANDQRMTNMASPIHGINPYRQILGQLGTRAKYGMPVVINPYRMQMGGMPQPGMGMEQGMANPSQQRMEQYSGQPPMQPQGQGEMSEAHNPNAQGQGQDQQMQQQLMQLAMAIVQGDPKAKQMFSQLPPEVQQMVGQMVQQIQQQQGGGQPQ